MVIDVSLTSIRSIMLLVNRKSRSSSPIFAPFLLFVFGLQRRNCVLSAGPRVRGSGGGAGGKCASRDCVNGAPPCYVGADEELIKPSGYLQAITSVAES